MSSLDWVRKSARTLSEQVKFVLGFAHTSYKAQVGLWVSIIFLGFPIWIVTLLLRPILEVRFWGIPATRLGHLVLETDLFVTKNIQSKKKVLFACFFAGDPINLFFSTTLTKTLWIWPRSLAGAAFIFQQAFSRRSSRHWAVGKLTEAKILTPSSRWIDDGLNMDEVKVLLETLGADPHKPYICLWARDSSYGSEVDPSRNQWLNSYRDVSIENYGPMVELIKKSGYEVIRMGRLSNDTERKSPPPYFDYSSSQQRSDRNDFLLTKYCSFAVAGDSGSVSIPLLYRKPIALVNIGSFIGLIDAPSVRIVTMKRLISSVEEHPITMSEIQKLGADQFNRRDQFEAKNISHIENSPEDLEAVAEEIIAIVEKDEVFWRDSDTVLQSSFLDMLAMIGIRNPTFKPSLNWLRANPQFVE